MSRQKAKGTAAEVAVRDFLREVGYPMAERLPTEGSKDRGDITGIDPGLVIEVKSLKEITLGSIIEEVAAEKVNAGADVGVAWIKRRMKGNPADWYVVMTGLDFVKLLHEWTGEVRR